ncbi:4Fe-4S binding protein [Fundidesulfovibrio butyratiphilus]
MNGHLRCTLAGLSLPSPIVVASCPAAESVDLIESAEDRGAGAVVLKSLSDGPEPATSGGARRIRYKPELGMFMLSSKGRELHGFEGARTLCREAAARVSIPLIASIAPVNLRADPWEKYAAGMVEAGAAAIQVDGYYLPRLWSHQGTADLHRFLEGLGKAAGAPVFMKLNASLPLIWVEEVRDTLPVQGWSLLDSVRVAPPLAEPDLSPDFDGVRRVGMCSLAGRWLAPLALEYTRVLAGRGKAVLGGGGVVNGGDAMDFLVRGADAVQVATAVLVHGMDWIRRCGGAIEARLGGRELSSFLARHRGGLVRGEKGLGTDTVRAVAVVDPLRCTRCGRCLLQTMCQAVEVDPAGLPRIIPSSCEGCGFCRDLCPVGAIEVFPVNRREERRTS